MKYYIIEPEVAGGFGENIVMNTSSHPPIVKKLHYEFNGWLGDCIVASFPCYMVTKSIQEQIMSCQMTGASFDGVEISTSELFNEIEEIYSDPKLPEFIWLKIHGIACKDDFGMTSDGMLVISENVLDLFRSNILLQATVTELKTILKS